MTLQNIKVTRPSQPARAIYSFYSGGWNTHCFRYNGKNRNYLSHICQFKTCCDLGHSVKVKDLITILSCLKVVFLLIWLQSPHWMSRYNIDNIWQYFICLDFAVSVILWPYEMRSWLQNQFLFLLKYSHIKSFTIHQLIGGFGIDNHYFD